MEAKRCYTCGEFKAGIYFAAMEKNCVNCVLDLKEAARLRSLNHSYVRNYGITLDDYNEIFAKQKGKCAICKKHQTRIKGKLVVDHCHETGKVRDLLCNGCNIKVGIYENSDIAKLKKYVDKHSTESRIK